MNPSILAIVILVALAAYAGYTLANKNTTPPTECPACQCQPITCPTTQCNTTNTPRLTLNLTRTNTEEASIQALT